MGEEWREKRLNCSPERVFLCTGPGAGQEVQTENVTVAEGGVAEITCRLHQYDGSIVVIQNPARQTLFFNGTRGECWGRESHLLGEEEGWVLKEDGWRVWTLPS